MDNELTEDEHDYQNKILNRLTSVPVLVLEQYFVNRDVV